VVSRNKTGCEVLFYLASFREWATAGGGGQSVLVSGSLLLLMSCYPRRASAYRRDPRPCRLPFGLLERRRARERSRNDTLGATCLPEPQAHRHSRRAGGCCIPPGAHQPAHLHSRRGQPYPNRSLVSLHTMCLRGPCCNVAPGNLGIEAYFRERRFCVWAQASVLP
jgi:hypothetical protein